MRAQLEGEARLAQDDEAQLAAELQQLEEALVDLTKQKWVLEHSDWQKSATGVMQLGTEAMAMCTEAMCDGDAATRGVLFSDE